MQALTQLDQGLVRGVALAPNDGPDVLFIQAGVGGDRIQRHVRIFSHHQLDRLTQGGMANATRLDSPWTRHRGQLCLCTKKVLGHICGNLLQTFVFSPICEVSVRENPHEAPELSVLGRAIRLTREQRNLSTDELACATAIPRENIEDLESGHLDPTYELLVTIAEGLGTHPSALVLLAEQLGQPHRP